MLLSAHDSEFVFLILTAAINCNAAEARRNGP